MASAQTLGLGGARLGGPRPRLAFLVDWLEDPYQAAVLNGALHVAREHQVTLVAFPGGVLGSPHHNGKFRNHLYDLVRPENFDGIISMTGTLANHVGLAGFESFCQRFARLPLCSIAVELQGSSSVLVDNQTGMEAAIEHLVTVHRCRRVAFIRGPEANAEAELRYQAYRDVLARHRLPFDERLVLMGDFQREGGERAVVELFDQRRVTLEDVDALAGAADLMLIGARQELVRRGIAIPKQMALIGFDDVDEARWLSPPLASVRQPLPEQGREAVGMLLRQITSGRSAERLVLKTELLPRGSCGCFLDEDIRVAASDANLLKLGLASAVIQRRPRLKAELTRAGRGMFGAAGRDWEERLLNALLDTAEGNNKAFLTAFDQLLTRQLAAGGDLEPGHAIISTLRQQLVALCQHDAAALSLLVGVFDAARSIAGKIAERAQAQKRLGLEVRLRQMTETSARLVSASSLDALSKVAYEQLPKLGVRSFYLSRYLGSDSDRAELLMGYGAWGQLRSGARSEFVASQLVPRDYVSYETAVQFLVEPLFHEGTPLGFAVFDLGEREGYTYEVLRELLSVALRGMLE